MKRILALILILALVVIGCGGSDECKLFIEGDSAAYQRGFIEGTYNGTQIRNESDYQALAQQERQYTLDLRDSQKRIRFQAKNCVFSDGINTCEEVWWDDDGSLVEITHTECPECPKPLCNCPKLSCPECPPGQNYFGGPCAEYWVLGGPCPEDKCKCVAFELDMDGGCWKWECE